MKFQTDVHKSKKKQKQDHLLTWSHLTCGVHSVADTQSGCSLSFLLLWSNPTKSFILQNNYFFYFLNHIARTGLNHLPVLVLGLAIPFLLHHCPISNGPPSLSTYLECSGQVWTSKSTTCHNNEYHVKASLISMPHKTNFSSGHPYVGPNASPTLQGWKFCWTASEYGIRFEVWNTERDSRGQDSP